MRKVGHTYVITLPTKKGAKNKTKQEAVTSYSTRKVKFFRRDGKKVPATLTGTLYKPIAS